MTAVGTALVGWWLLVGGLVTADRFGGRAVNVGMARASEEFEAVVRWAARLGRV